MIDTGVDYKHPALGGCFGPGCKVAYGYDFVGDDYDNGDSDKDTPKPDKDPMDCAGHGTHVAGIVAARNEGPDAMGPQVFVGVAPDGERLGHFLAVNQQPFFVVYG
jgi:subtilisin family serine protease